MKLIVFSVIAALAIPAWGQEKPEPAKPEAMKEKEASAPKQAAAGPKIPKQRRWNEDARHCLERGSNTDIIKCAEEFL